MEIIDVGRRGGANDYSALGQLSTVDLRLIGSFQLTFAGLPVALQGGGERLLALLAIRKTRLRRSYVAGCLWPESMEAQARASLRTTVWRLGCLEYPIVEASRDHICLAAEVHVDLHEATEVIKRLLEDPDSASLSDCRCALLHSDLLPDWYEEPFILERERFRDLRVHALEIACGRMTKLGRFGEAVDAASAAVRAEPLRESSNRALICAYIAEGNVDAAMRQFKRFQGSLRNELGISVSSQMRALFEPLRTVGRSARLPSWREPVYSGA